MLDNEGADNEEGSEGAAGADDQEGAGEGADGAAAEGGDKQQAKPSRKDRQAARAGEHGEIQRLREELARQGRESLALQRQLAETMAASNRQVADVVSRSAPKEESTRDRLTRELEESAKQIREDDPTSFKRYIAKQAELVEALADERANTRVQAEGKRIQQEIPQQKTGMAVRLESSFPWLEEEWPAVLRLAKNLGKDRDLTDETVREATIREAATKWAALQDLPVHGTNARDASDGRRRVAGTGSRAGGGGGADDETDGADIVARSPVMRQMADQYFGSVKDVKARHRKYFNEYVKPEIDKQQRR